MVCTDFFFMVLAYQSLCCLRDCVTQDPTLECQPCCVLQMDLSTFVPQELSNVIWAYGTMQYQQNPEFLRRAAQEILSREISRFEPQAISNVCWALAKHDLVYDEFMEVLCQPTPDAICLAGLCMVLLKITHVRCSMPL